MIHFENRDCMDAMKEFPDNFFDLAIVDPPYGDGSHSVNVERERAREREREPIIDSAADSTSTRIPRGGGTANRNTTSVHRQGKNCLKPDGTWGYPNRRNMGEEIRKKSLRGMLRRNKNILTSCFASHGIK